MRVVAWAGSLLKPSQPSPKGRGRLPVPSDCFDRATGQRFFARGALGFIFGLLTDVRVSVFERASEVFRGGVAADITIDAGAVDVERAGDVLFNAVAGVRHIRIRTLAKLLSTTMQN